MASLTKKGEECRTCALCPYDGPHAFHGCECDWRNDGHVDPETGLPRGGAS